MWLGVARVSLELTDIGSIKDKRSIVKPIVLKVMNKYNIHAAEVDDLDFNDSAVIGLVLCGNEQRHVNEVLSKAVDWIENHQFEAHVSDIETEFIQVF
jgi:uncharacterized protein YlxP (DUF503 family)